MRIQKKIWQDEHASNSALPALAEAEPSTQVVRFIDYLKAHNVKIGGRAVDIGSGKGRNSVYLASLGYKTYGLEYIDNAVKTATQLAKDKGMSTATEFLLTDIDKPWFFDDDFFDLAVDCFSSIDIENKIGREICRDEMYRTLKPGGYALVTVVSIHDEWESDAIANHPGAEPNSSIWPQNGKFQKDYDKSELREFLDVFEIVELDEVSKPALKLGVEGIATNIWTIVRKPE